MSLLLWLTYLKLHLRQLLRPLDQKGRAHIEVEIREPLLLRQIRIPHPDDAADGELAHEQAVDPAEAKLHELDPFTLEVFRQPGIDARGEVLEGAHLPHDSRLGEDVVVLDAVEEFGEAPEGVGFDGVEHGAGQLPGVHAAFDARVRDVAAEEDLPEGRDEVVDPLHVAAGGVADGPDVEDSFK